VKYIPLVWAGLWRKPIRTVLTFLSITVAFTLFGSLRGITTGIETLLEGMSANRLRVQSSDEKSPLPVAYSETISRLPGVSSVTTLTFLRAYSKERTSAIGVVALGGSEPFGDDGEFRVTESERLLFANTKPGALVGRRLAESFGWRVGDVIPLMTNVPNKDGTKGWAFTVVGFYDTRIPQLAQQVWFHYDFLNEHRLRNKNTVDALLVNSNDPNKNESIAEAVDRFFENSDHPTITQSDRESARVSIKQTLDVGLLVNIVIGASMFALLFITSNTMVQSVHQRIREFATLKTMGFADMEVFWLVFAEAIALCSIGATFGLAIARMLFPLIGALVEPILMPVGVVASAFMMSLALAIFSASVPALRVKKMSISSALMRS
jgi:putative ABC transport system permease protein